MLFNLPILVVLPPPPSWGKGTEMGQEDASKEKSQCARCPVHKRIRRFEGWKAAHRSQWACGTRIQQRESKEARDDLGTESPKWAGCGQGLVLTHTQDKIVMASWRHSPITMSTPSMQFSTQHPADRPSLNRPRRGGLDRKYSSSFNANVVVLGCRWPCRRSRNQSGPRLRNTCSFNLEGQDMKASHLSAHEQEACPEDKHSFTSHRRKGHCARTVIIFWRSTVKVFQDHGTMDGFIHRQYCVRRQSFSRQLGTKSRHGDVSAPCNPTHYCSCLPVSLHYHQQTSDLRHTVAKTNPVVSCDVCTSQTWTLKCWV